MDYSYEGGSRRRRFHHYRWAAIGGVFLVLAGCSTSAPTPEAAPTSTVVPATPSPAATATVMPEPTPTPIPSAADVVSETVFASGEMALRITPSGSAPVTFLGGFSPSGVQLEFILAEFLEFAALADPSLATDPLAGEAGDLLTGPWVVRVVDGVVFVQQDLLVSAAEGLPGDWVRVDDPAIAELLDTAGVLAGGLDQPIAVEMVRSAGQAMVFEADEELGEVAASRYRTDLEGSQLSVLGLDAAASAAFIGIDQLHTQLVPALVWIDDSGVLVGLELQVPAAGFGPGSTAAEIALTYGPVEGGFPVEAPETFVTLSG